MEKVKDMKEEETEEMTPLMRIQSQCDSTQCSTVWQQPWSG